MAKPAGGLAINQLIKMKCAGQISLEQFLALTAGTDGFTEDSPVICEDEPTTSRCRSSCNSTVARVSRWKVQTSRDVGPRAHGSVHGPLHGGTEAGLWPGRCTEVRSGVRECVCA